jgi:integrase
MKPQYSTNIRHRKTWTWEIRIKRNDLWEYHSSQSGYDTRKEAAADLQTAVSNLKLQPEQADWTYKEIAEVYIATGNKAINTTKAYQSWLSSLFKLLDMKITKIKRADVEKAIYLYYDNHSYRSTISVFRFCKSVFKYAIDALEIDMRNPCIGIKIIERPDKAPKEIRPLTTSQMQAIIKKLSKAGYKDVAFLLALAGFCGLRIGEARGLTKGAINLKEGQLRVIKQRLADGSVTTRLKTRNSKRTVPIPDSIRSVIKAMPTPLNDTTLYVDKLYSSEQVEYALVKIGSDARPHEFRHSYGTSLVQRGVDFRTIAALMGDTVQTVMSTYAHVNKEMMDAAIKVAKTL